MNCATVDIRSNVCHWLRNKKEYEFERNVKSDLKQNDFIKEIY